MSWITEIPVAEASGPLKDVYEDLTRKRGKIANILQVHSLRPGALKAHVDLYMDLMFANGGLSRRERELIAVVVSRRNGCDYCVAHHAEALARYVSDRDLLDAVAAGGFPETLTAREHAIARYASELTVAPGAVGESAIQELRTHGLPDADILLVNLITSYFNFVNRIALGLGVTATRDEVEGYDV
jgi:uncharacterized peroxidase-related enzyme